MDTHDKKRYNPQAHLAARRNDPQRMRKAKEDASVISCFLKERYGAQVYGIGSLFSNEQTFSKTSDIDLVVKGLPKEDFFYISAKAQELTRFRLDIIPYEDANELIRETVKERGVRL